MVKKKRIENKLSTFTNVILGIFADQPFRPKNYKQVCKTMGIKDQAGKDVVYNLLIDLKNKGLLQEARPYSYVMSNAGMAQFGPKTKYVEGTVEMKSTGKAYVVRDDGEGEDIFIAAQDTYKALHGDRVRVAMFPKRNNSKPEVRLWRCWNVVIPSSLVCLPSRMAMSLFVLMWSGCPSTFSSHMAISTVLKTV